MGQVPINPACMEWSSVCERVPSSCSAHVSQREEAPNHLHLKAQTQKIMPNMHGCALQKVRSWSGLGVYWICRALSIIHKTLSPSINHVQVWVTFTIICQNWHIEKATHAHVHNNMCIYIHAYTLTYAIVNVYVVANALPPCAQLS